MLSKREKDVVGLLLQGKSNKQIALALGLSERTIEFHLNNILPIGMKLAFQPFIMGGMACYAISLDVWIMALSRVPVSIAYPMLSIGYVINAFVAWQWLGEALTAQKLLGIAVIVIGVILVTRS